MTRKDRLNAYWEEHKANVMETDLSEIVYRPAHPAELKSSEHLPEEARKRLFLDVFSKTGIIGEACSFLYIPRSRVKIWRRDDEAFNAAFLEAQEAAVDDAEAELRRRAVTGINEPVLYKGEVVWKRDPNTGEIELDDNFEPIPLTLPRRSDRLLEVYMGAKRPQYRGGKGGTSVSIGTGSPDDMPNSITIRLVDSDGDGGMIEHDPLED